MFKKILLVLLVALVAIQFFHPARNESTGEQTHYIGKTYPVPDDVKQILAKACNDCHSNNTRYPWYSKLQPVDWWLTDHINDGKKHLNFDEYTSRSLRYQYNKMKETIEEVKEGGMPLDSYTWIHKDAILTDAEKTRLFDWANGVMDSLEAHYPMDSLIRKRP